MPADPSFLIQYFSEKYPNVECSLHFRNLFELLIATILSAQTTDAKVNQLSPQLFQNYPDAKALASALEEDLQALIRPLGMKQTRARHIKGCSQILVEQFKGEVPSDRLELMSLPGVGRKTAHVVLGVGFKLPALVVDTHVSRISQRLGLTLNKDPLKIENDLCRQFPEDCWVKIAHWFISFGREQCKAVKPACSSCEISQSCKYNLTTKELK